jgi:hypothetical protein
MGNLKIEIPSGAIANFCVENQIRRLALFGSVLSDDFRDDSDLDVLVEFLPEARIGFRLFELEVELSDLIGRKVDLSTPGFLSRYFRDDVMREAQDLYVET